jgi:hypothetical protein
LSSTESGWRVGDVSISDSTSNFLERSTGFKALECRVTTPALEFEVETGQYMPAIRQEEIEPRKSLSCSFTFSSSRHSSFEFGPTLVAGGSIACSLF